MTPAVWACAVCRPNWGLRLFCVGAVWVFAILWWSFA